VGPDEVELHALARRVAEPQLVQGIRPSRLRLTFKVFNRVNVHYRHVTSLPTFFLAEFVLNSRHQQGENEELS
jgi:hypothetical protein